MALVPSGLAHTRLIFDFRNHTWATSDYAKLHDNTDCNRGHDKGTLHDRRIRRLSPQSALHHCACLIHTRTRLQTHLRTRALQSTEVHTFLRMRRRERDDGRWKQCCCSGTTVQEEQG
jgi:hypothetical protein